MSRLPLAIAPVLLLAVVACGGSYAAPVPRVQVPADAVRFDDVRHAALHRQPLGLANTGTAPVRVTLVAEAPFSASTDAITLPAGGVASVDVLFQSDAFDTFEGAVRVTSAGGVAT